MKKVVIVGGNGAGMSAASQIKRRQPRWDVIVLERGSDISYASCGIPYYIGGEVSNRMDLIAVTPEAAINERNIDLRLQHEVVAVKPEEKRVQIKTAQGEVSETYDFLILATGALALTHGIAVTSARRIFTLKNLADGDKVFQAMEALKPKTCAVVGGGYIAVEMLEAFKMRGLETHLIHRRAELAKTFEKEISDLTLQEMEKQGIVLKLNRSVQEIMEKDGQAVVKTADEELSYDLVVVSTGVKPNSALAKDCGIELGIKEAIKVNTKMETNIPGIYAAGDCVETINLITGGPAHVPLALKANKEGIVAGANISGEQQEFPGILGTAITKFFDLGLARTGLTLAEAEKNGFTAFKYGVSAGTKAGYFPGAGTLKIFVVAERESGRVLGAQMAGPVDAVKRIDVYATIIYNKMTLQDVFNMDLSYAPPFSPVFDPVLLSARVGLKKVTDK